MTSVNITKLPHYLYQPKLAVEDSLDNTAERHKKLLDLGESLLHYISGILFGEYKRSGAINEDIEAEFYKYSKRPPSLGVFLNFVRLLTKELDHSVLLDNLNNRVIFKESAEFVFSFGLIKKAIDYGLDEDFEEKIATLRKQHNVKQVGLVEFFDTFVTLRNIYAHPEQKAGLNDAKRKWPLSHEYFDYINRYLENAFNEIIDKLDVLIEYRCGATAEIFDETKQAEFLIEQGSKKVSRVIQLTKEQLKAISVDDRYLLDSDDVIYSKLYYHRIPPVNTLVSEKIIKREKANLILPHLKQLIRDKLADDGRLDALEYMVISDTARAAFVSEDNLFAIIDGIRRELKIDADVGTPDNKGPLFIEKHKGHKRLSFNPYWLKHFLWLQKVPLDYQKKERENVVKKFDSKIESIKRDLKNLPGRDKIDNAEDKIRIIRSKLKDIRSRQKEIASTYRDKQKSARSNERIEALKVERAGLEERLQLQIDKYELEIQDLRARIVELETKQADLKSDLLDKLNMLDQSKQIETAYTTWGIQASLWEEFEQYINGLIDENLNNEEGNDQLESTKSWVNESNSWQIGNLSHYYWGKIYPVAAPLGKIRHIGFWMGKNFRWVSKNIPEVRLKDRIDQINIVLWTSSDDKLASKIESDNRIFVRYSELCQNMVNSNYSTLQKLGMNVKCADKNNWKDDKEDADDSDLFVTLDYYLNNLKDTHQIKQLYSRVYTLSDFYDRGEVNLEEVSRMENELESLMSLFSNIISEINDYANMIGLNHDEINKREEQFVRYQKLLHNKFQTGLTSEGFRPTDEMVTEWKKYAFETLSINQYSFDIILNSFRWRNKSKA
jgi:predicted  nucleic acid-binding Zn-ribbon protein